MSPACPPRVSACPLATRATLGVSRSRGVRSPPGSLCVRYPSRLLPTPNPSQAALRALGASEGEGEEGESLKVTHGGE